MAGQMKALGALSLTPHPEYRKPKVKQEKPAYAVINDGFFDENDKFWYPNQMLYYEGEPNLNLYPLNKLANDKLNLFLGKLNELGEDMARKTKKRFTPHPIKDWTETEDVEVPQIENVMGVPKTTRNDEIR